jgi:hypothetical protein
MIRRLLMLVVGLKGRVYHRYKISMGYTDKQLGTTLKRYTVYLFYISIFSINKFPKAILTFRKYGHVLKPGRWTSRF